MMQTEKMKVLELLEAGKISAEEAVSLLNAVGGPRFMKPETRDDLEVRFNQFGKDVQRFAKDAGTKAQGLYKDLEPKIKKHSHDVITKVATALDSLACQLGESLENVASDLECCCEDECNCTPVCTDEVCECGECDESKPRANKKHKKAE